MPVPVPLWTNPAGSITTDSFLCGMAADLPARSAPLTSPSYDTCLLWNSSLRAHSGLTIHFSPSTVIFLYVMSGLTHRFTTPNIVSGLRVAVGITYSPSLNLISVYSVKSGSTSPSVSCCDTGFWSFGHHPTGWDPWMTRFLSLSALICHWMNLLYTGSMVVNSLLQSMEYPISTIPVLISSWK